MTPEVFYMDTDATLEECMALMTAKHIRHLPVLENKQLVGIVTLGDVVKQIIVEQKFTSRKKYCQSQGFGSEVNYPILIFDFIKFFLPA